MTSDRLFTECQELLLWVKSLETTMSALSFQTVNDHTSFEVWPILLGIDWDVNGGAVPAHVRKRLLTRLLDLPCGSDDGLHELQVAATQLGLGGHHAQQQLTVLGLVDVERCRGV